MNDFYCKVEQNGDLFNFSDLMEENDTLPKETVDYDTISKDPMILSFNNINITNSQANYTDLLLDHTISVKDINLFVPGFTLNSGSTNLAINFDFTQGGRLKSGLNFNQVDSTYAISLELDSLNLDILEPYLKNSLDISNVKGYFSNNILLEGNLQHVMQIKMKGINKIESFGILDKENRNVLSFDEFRINIDTLLLYEKKIKINEIALINPFALFEIIDSTDNWSAIIISSDSISTDTTETKEEVKGENSDFTYSLAKLELQNGEILFRDKSLSTEFESRLHHFNIKSSNIRTTSSEVQIDISAKLNQMAQISSEIKLNPQNTDDMNVVFSVQNFAMKDIEPYLLHYFGYQVNDGLFNLSTKDEITSNSLNSENKIYIRKFELEKSNKKEAEYRLLLKLAVGVLSDKDGIIDLNVPVESKGEETSIGNVGKLILKTFSNLIVKAATSPVDFLATLYGVNPDKIKAVEVGVFENNFEENEMETLDIIAKILKDKPQLFCQMKYNINKEKYFDSLAIRLTSEEFKKTRSYNENIKNNTIYDSLFRSFVIRKLDIKDEKSSENIVDLCKSYIGNELLSARLDSTNEVHYHLINDYLISYKSINSERFRIIPDSENSVPPNYEKAIFKVNFTTEENLE